MRRALFVAFCCLGLSACNTGSGPSFAHGPARNGKLAALGWKENTKPFALGMLDTTVAHALVCQDEKCGGPGVYMVGEGTVSDTGFGHIVAAIESASPSQTDAVIADIQRGSLRQDTQGVNVESVKKLGKEVVIVANAPTTLPNGQSGVAVLHLSFEGGHMHLEAGVAASHAAAASLFRLAASV